jgi:hypothetical protein
VKCGEKGWTTAAGTPCQQNIGKGAVGCLWHSKNEVGRAALAMKGGIASRMKRALPATYEIHPFENREDVIRFANTMATLALKHDVDTRRIDCALRAAGLALQAFAQAVNERLVDALLQVEHGGVALTLYRNLTAVTSSTLRRPLPPRRVTGPDPDVLDHADGDEDASA